MSQYTAPGGVIIDSGDKRVTRKVVVSTGGENPQPPGGPGRLTNSSITSEPGGIRRGVFEYTEGGEGGANYNVYGKKRELLGGSREVPIYKHPNFKTLSDEEKKALSSDIKDIFAEAKSAGFDVKVLRAVIRLRKQEPAEVEEQETLLDLYRRALGM